MGNRKPQPRRGGKKGRKIGRNYRWDGVTHSVTKYRARHFIPNGPRKKEKGSGEANA